MGWLIAMITPRKVLAFVVILLLCLALLNQRWTGYVTRPIFNIVDFFQYPAGWIAANFKPDPQVEHPEFTDAQLSELKEQWDAYNMDLWLENRKLKEQLAAFEAIALIQDIKAIRPVEAKVSRFSPDKVNPTVRLLRGSLHGIKVDDAVVYKSNLLGFVEAVGPANCTVTLITKPSYRTEITIMPPGQVRMQDNWPVIARAESDGKGGFKTELEDAITQALRPGDIVRVSDTLRESANGFSLGVIDKIEDHDTRPYDLDIVTIRPRTLIGPQRMVTVLTDRTD